MICYTNLIYHVISIVNQPILTMAILKSFYYNSNTWSSRHCCSVLAAASWSIFSFLVIFSATSLVVLCSRLDADLVSKFNWSQSFKILRWRWSTFLWNSRYTTLMVQIVSSQDLCSKLDIDSCVRQSKCQYWIKISIATHSNTFWNHAFVI